MMESRKIQPFVVTVDAATVADLNERLTRTRWPDELEGTDQASNWQNILVKGSSSIRTPADLAGKTIAVNALKGVGEVMIRAALEKAGVDQNSIKLLALPFPAMRAALNSGQVDAIWTPEPFLSQAINIDGARDLFAPGPVLGKYFPIGGYFVRTDWASRNAAVAARFRTAMNQSLEYAGRVADYLEFAELVALDALTRKESCGGHFREESQTPDNEAMRDDVNVLRAFMRVLNLLDPPQDVMQRPEILQAVMRAWQDRANRPPLVTGPSRSEMLDLLRPAA